MASKRKRSGMLPAHKTRMLLMSSLINWESFKKKLLFLTATSCGRDKNVAIVAGRSVVVDFAR